jgi:hypothetical protein
MNKILRYSFVALLAMLFGNVSAENVIWQEDWSSWGDYAKKVIDGVNPNYVFEGTVTNEDGSFKSGTTIYNEKLAGGEAPELLVAKNTGKFIATINLGSNSGDMTLSFKCNKNIPVEVSGGTIGENTGSGNDYSYAITGASGTLTITFNNSTSANARLDNIKLFQGQGKKAAGLSWGTSSRTVTLGADDNVFPTLQNENNLTVTYSSSDQTVATIASDGTITLVAAGKTTIKAESAETDEYEAGKAEYELTVKEAEGGGGEEQVQLITVAKALEIIAGLENGATTTEKYQVKGFIVGAPDFQRKDDQSLYGNCNFEIADTKGGSDKLTIFRAKSYDNKNFTEEEVSAKIIEENDLVVLEGQLQKYVKDEVVTPELKNCYLISVEKGSTGITNITADKAANAVRYNLAGQKVNAGFKGVVIVNGQKMLQK